MKTFQKMQRGKDDEIEKENLHKVTEIQGNIHSKQKTNTIESTETETMKHKSGNQEAKLE